MRKIAIVAMAAMLVSPALAADLQLSIVRTDCRPTFGANTTIQFDILGELTGSANEGLAAFGFDLSAQLDGQDFDVTSATVTAPSPAMDAFAVRGLRNPAGFGGTPIGGVLVQIGAGQNTINNPGPIPPFPQGDVDFGIGVGGPQVLASVSIILSQTPADRYVFTVSNGFGNVIKEGEVDPPQMVEAIENVTNAMLEVAPLACPLDIDEDRQINPVDSGLVQSRFGCAVGTGDCDCDRVDIDGDGQVNPVDSGLVQSGFGVCP
jgi:hypothetical protein